MLGYSCETYGILMGGSLAFCFSEVSRNVGLNSSSFFDGSFSFVTYASFISHQPSALTALGFSGLTSVCGFQVVIVPASLRLRQEAIEDFALTYTYSQRLVGVLDGRGHPFSIAVSLPLVRLTLWVLLFVPPSEACWGGLAYACHHGLESALAKVVAGSPQCSSTRHSWLSQVVLPLLDRSSPTPATHS